MLIDDRVAIEAETRKFSIDNVIKNLQFQKIIIVCSPENLESFRSQLEASGIRDRRVQIMTTAEILAREADDILS